MAPLVSLLVPSYNHARFLPSLLEGMLAQRWPNLELLVLDDGSRDETSEVVARFRGALEKRFTRFVYRARENRGLTATLNELFALAQGEFVSICASDDRMRPEAMSRLVPALQANPDAVLACADAAFIDATGHQVFLRADASVTGRREPGTYDTALAYFLNDRPELLTNGEFGKHYTLLRGNYLPMGSLLRASAARYALPYPDGLMLEDLYFWLKLSRHGRFIVVPEVLMEYRQHGANTSRTRGERLRADRFKLLLAERDYAASTGHLDDWQRAMESALSLRGLSELRAAHAAGFDTLGFLRRRAMAHVRRLRR